MLAAAKPESCSPLVFPKGHSGMTSSENNIHNLNEIEDFTEIHSSWVAAFIAGMGYIFFFLPVCWIETRRDNLPFLETLLLVHVPPHIEDAFANFIFPKFNINTDLSFLSALGIFYGVNCLLYVLIQATARPHRMLSFITSSNGLLLGFIATLQLSGNVLHSIELSFEDYRIYIIKYFYILTLFMFFSLIKQKLPQRETWRPQFGMLFDGLFAISVSYIFIIGYDPTLITIISGPIFLIVSFLAMIFVENTVTRLAVVQLAVVLHLVRKIPDEDVETREERPPLREALGTYLGTYKVMLRKPLGSLAKQIEEWEVENRKAFPAVTREMVIDLVSVTAYAAIFILFPIGVSLLYWLLGGTV